MFHKHLWKYKNVGIETAKYRFFMKFFAISFAAMDLQDRRVMRNILWLPPARAVPTRSYEVYTSISDKPRRERGIMVLWKQLAAVSPVMYIDTVARLRSKFMQATRLVKTNDRVGKRSKTQPALGQ